MKTIIMKEKGNLKVTKIIKNQDVKFKLKVKALGIWITVLQTKWINSFYEDCGEEKYINLLNCINSIITYNKHGELR